MRIATAILWSLPLLSSPAAAACLNPFGCASETRSECIRRVSEKARTDAGARAALGQCQQLPAYTAAQCRRLESAWAEHLRTNAASEWNFKDKDAKEDCRKHHPDTFKPSIWVTRASCAALAGKLARTGTEFQPGSKYSNRMIRVKNEAGPMYGIEGWALLEVIRQVEFPEVPLGRFAADLFMDSPPDQPQVYEECKGMGAL
jgi:hypothetical protein